MGNARMEVIGLSEHEKWDGIVRSFRDHDVYSLSGYVKAFEIHGDGEPLLFYYESPSLRGYNVVMKRDIADDPNFRQLLPRDTWYDLATPYGYGGWLTEGAGDTSELDDAYTRLCAQNNIVCEFVRFHPVWNNAPAMEQMYDVVHLGPTIALDLKDPETIWSNIISKNRNMIRKAQKNGIQILRGRAAKDFGAFKYMYDKTMNKDSADDYYYFADAFYDSIREDLPENAQVFTAMYEDRPIAAAIMLYENGLLNYHLSGSDENFRTLAPTNLILYEAAVWGSEHGCRSFHLGGGLGSHEDNLFKFKRSFYKGEPKRFSIGRKIFMADAYAQLNAHRADAPKSGFFPEYRRPGAKSEE